MMRKIILFTHPEFLGSMSMPRFSKMIAGYLVLQGIEYEIWSPKPVFYRIVPGLSVSKWLGYVDQYVLFPLWVRLRLLHTSRDVLFVFCDQALGPWVPLVSKRPHVIHCHDLMALKSALGLVPENPVSVSGRMYQKYIRRGFQKGRRFIPISKKTARDLHDYAGIDPSKMTVVYNGINYPFGRIDRKLALEMLNQEGILESESNCLLHVGGGQWYKNTVGVIKLYGAYCKITDNPFPLIMVSPPPSGSILSAVNQLPSNADIRFFQKVDVRIIEALYSIAGAFLFPSLDEGFGWPIIEAQACGCPVITTDAAPMNEIGGGYIEYLPKYSPNDENSWLQKGTEKILMILFENEIEKENRRNFMIEWSRNFSPEPVLKRYLQVYESTLKEYLEDLSKEYLK